MSALGSPAAACCTAGTRDRLGREAAGAWLEMGLSCREMSHRAPTPARAMLGQ